MNVSIQTAIAYTLKDLTEINSTMSDMQNMIDRVKANIAQLFSLLEDTETAIEQEQEPKELSEPDPYEPE